MTVITTQQPGVVSLRDRRAHDPALTGAKAASLARAAGQGLPVLDGFVLTTAWPGRGDPPEIAWRRLSKGGARALVVRSSSVAEDSAEHSMAGMFTSVLDVRGWEQFRAAVAEVRASAASVADSGSGEPGAAMAVLVQPFLRAAWGGVLFTADPVSGRRDRMVLTAVRGGPDVVVGGMDAGWTASVTRGGRIGEVLATDGPMLPNSLRRMVVRLAVRAERVFGGPLDIEWAIDANGNPILLQARPITAIHGPGEGVILGPGPLAETFPDPLRPLEQDLWLTPLDDGLRVALDLAGSASARRLRGAPVARAVSGIAVADLQALGVVPQRGGVLRWIDPRPGARKLGAAVRVGRLAAALPELGRRVCERVDTDLAEVPPLHELRNDNLLDLLQHTRTALTSLHGYEALAGMLGTDRRPAPTGAAMALIALADAQAAGLSAEQPVEEYPVLLALTPPRIGGPLGSVLPDSLENTRPAPAPREREVELGERSVPSVHENAFTAMGSAGDRNGAGEFDAGGFGELSLIREALRLRVRWVQELGARAAVELGRRLSLAGLLADPAAVALLSLGELRAAVTRRRVPADLSDRAAPEQVSVPDRFRLSADGVPVPVRRSTGSATHGVGAGGGSGRGVVHMGDRPPAGSVLVVRHLDPRLATVVPRLAGLIAETGSPLSHVAILAREHRVPVIVGYADATRRLPDGALVELDGRTGEVRVLPGNEGGLS
ncbi:pyruvate, phosphate dikinase [Nocardia huaxiensis]|uniref:Pyruvate, phosphate dikinase n=1 Tax=Nocardia huaxiensis TaxID=2755382 RepID=A0A7D6YZ58_9NOCA|nr:PEP/pyruvate-binding domain-containing protein [Nocardia huaxiensis]QLY28026.1 pyruvate, phosphate dikinase [Nocardia huaxiensis]